MQQRDRPAKDGKPARKGKMEPAVFILAIMGCHEGSAMCEPLAFVPTPYESVAACEAASANVVPRHIDTDLPVVVVECLRMDAAAAALLRSGDLKQIEPEEGSRPVPVRTPRPSARARG
jgi:hypothetical protein